MIHTVLADDTFGDEFEELSALACLGIISAALVKRQCIQGVKTPEAITCMPVKSAFQLKGVSNTMLWVSPKRYDQIGGLREITDITCVNVVEEPTVEFFETKLDEVLAPLGA